MRSFKEGMTCVLKFSKTSPTKIPVRLHSGYISISLKIFPVTYGTFPNDLQPFFCYPEISKYFPITKFFYLYKDSLQGINLLWEKQVSNKESEQYILVVLVLFLKNSNNIHHNNCQNFFKLKARKLRTRRVCPLVSLDCLVSSIFHYQIHNPKFLY
jgi:hypothetical protein